MSLSEEVKKCSSGQNITIVPLAVNCNDMYQTDSESEVQSTPNEKSKCNQNGESSFPGAKWDMEISLLLKDTFYVLE